MATRKPVRAVSAKTEKVRAKTRITSVTFRSSIELAPFQHAHVEASAEVGAGADPADTLQDVKNFVAFELLRAKHGDSVPESVRQPFRAALGLKPERGYSPQQTGRRDWPGHRQGD